MTHTIQLSKQAMKRGMHFHDWQFENITPNKFQRGGKMRCVCKTCGAYREY
jgi:hypothetical protein